MPIKKIDTPSAILITLSTLVSILVIFSVIVRSYPGIFRASFRTSVHMDAREVYSKPHVRSSISST